MTRTFLLILILLLEISNQAHARRPRQFTTAEGLSTNTVYSIEQDNRGVIWIGTVDGLHSYDGNSIRAWRDPSVQSLGAQIYCVKEGPDDKLWIGSDHGLSTFDLKREKFDEFNANSAFGYKINTGVRDIMIDHDGRVWIATLGQGLFRYDPKDDKLVQYAAVAQINSDFTSRVYEDSENNIWVSTRDNGLSLYLPDKDYFKPIATKQLPNTVALFEDSRNNFWVGGDNGLYRLDRKTMELEHVIAPPPGSIVLQVRQLIEYPEGNLLFVSDSGLGQYNLDTGEYQIHGAQASSSSQLSDNHLHAIHADHEGGLWLGSYFGGVNYIPALSNRFRTINRDSSSFPGRIVGVVAPGKDGNIWLGTDESGFYLWNRADDSFKAFSAGNPGSPPTYNNVHALLQDGDSLYIGMYMGGLDILDLHTGKFTNHKSSGNVKSLYSSNVYSLLKDSAGDVWIGTSAGLNRFAPETGDFDRIFEVGRADVECMFEDSRGNLFVLSTDRGVFMRNAADGNWENFFRKPGDTSREGIPTNNFLCGAEDSSGMIWLGTDGSGIVKFNPEDLSFRNVEFPQEIRSVYKIIPFEDRLWITTNKGLFSFYPATGVLRHFSKDEGVDESSFRPNSGLILDDGTALAGGTDGIVEFHPGEFSAVPRNPKVFLTDFRLFNRPVDVDEKDSPLKTSITYADKLVLPHDKSDFSMKIAVMSYDKPSLNRVAYMLDGYDKEWKEAADDRTASYNGLPPGKYTFRVKTGDGLGGWNREAINLPVEILPPWWRSRLMIIVYILIGVGIVWLLTRFYDNRQKRKFEQLIRLREKEDTHNRMEFFTQMAHELRTPLTLILSPLETVIQSKGSVEEAMPHLKVMERNGKRLLTLVNQLMDFRKIESGNIRTSMQNISLRAELRSTIHSFSSYMKNHDVELVTVYPDNDCVASMDREAFAHIIGNLISNALKFAKSKVEVRLETTDDGYYAISVTDDGPGIPEAEKEKIFAPFYQIKENLPADYIGTGIGLMLVKEYVKLIDGDISITSAPGEGACFTVKFKDSLEPEPQVEDQADPDVSVSETEAEPGETDADAAADNPQDAPDEKSTVLVVEDNSDMRELLSRQLGADFKVMSAPNGAEAMKILEANQIDLVLTDVMMPVMDGLELCRRIKCDIVTSHIPVVLLTAKSDKEDFVEGYGRGADAYVAKPFSIDVVRAQVDAILRNRKRIRRNFLAKPESDPDIVPNSSLDKIFFDKLTAIVEQRLTDPDFSVDILAREIGISRTGLFTKIKAVCGMTPNGFIKVIRLRKAAALLAHPDARVNEVCIDVGFSSRSHFAKSFQDQYGVSPTAYRASLSE